MPTTGEGREGEVRIEPEHVDSGEPTFSREPINTGFALLEKNLDRLSDTERAMVRTMLERLLERLS